MSINITHVVWEAKNMPSGLSIAADTGIIFGTPTCEAGTYTPTITISTNYGTDSTTVTIVVKDAESGVPIITDGQTVNVTKGEEMAPYTMQGTNINLT